MSTLGISEIRGHLSDVLNRVHFGGEKIQISSRGKVRAVLIPYELAEKLALTDVTPKLINRTPEILA